MEQYNSRITLQVNGVGLGGYAASKTTEITMRLHPGSNTITLTDEPNAKTSWARLFITRDPPLPQLLLFQTAGSADVRLTDLGNKHDVKPHTVTKTFTFLAS